MISLRKAINEKCKECIYDRLQPGNWRQQVEGCLSPRCPLFAVRPTSKGAKLAPERRLAA